MELDQLKQENYPSQWDKLDAKDLNVITAVTFTTLDVACSYKADVSTDRTENGLRACFIRYFSQALNLLTIQQQHR
jgi:hypothetical protein